MEIPISFSMTGLKISFAIILWYGSSAVANTSSRKILNLAPTPVLLTFCQFMISSISLFLVLPSRSSKENFTPFSILFKANDTKRKLLLKLSLIYMTGFLFVNAGYVFVNVSLAETLRAAEPLVSILLVKLFLTSETTNALMMFSMLPIFIGGLLSSMSDKSFSFTGLAFVTVSNVAFSMRSLITKQLKNEGLDMNAFELFLTISEVGTVILFGLLCLEWVIGLISLDLLMPLISSEAQESGFKLLLVNGFSYFAYNQMSFYVLSNVTMVSHAVANALRRVVTIMFSVWYFRNEINATNSLGIFLAIVGVLLYSYSKTAPTNVVKKEKDTIETDKLEEDYVNVQA